MRGKLLLLISAKGHVAALSAAPQFYGVFQADGGIKKGRAAFGDLTNQSQGKGRHSSAKVRSVSAGSRKT